MGNKSQSKYPSKEPKISYDQMNSFVIDLPIDNTSDRHHVKTVIIADQKANF